MGFETDTFAGVMHIWAFGFIFAIGFWMGTSIFRGIRNEWKSVSNRKSTAAKTEHA